jgi:hypothetical protein
MADALLNGGDDGGDDIFVYTGGEQEVPDDVRRAKIDESIDTIPRRAFADCEQLIEVEGHDKLKKIEEAAFLRCRSLRRVMKMNGVIEIEYHAFLGCYALRDLEFDKLEIIGNSSFVFCNSLRSINLPSVRRIGQCAFQECKALTDAVLGEEMEGIGTAGGGAFYKCTALRRIAIPLKDNLIVEDGAFDGCENLSSVDIIGAVHKTISSLHMKRWRDEMKEEIDGINQTLPEISANEKTDAIEQWLDRILDRMEHYKAEHQQLLKDAMTLLELALWKANLDENGVDLEGVRVTRRQVKRARKERCITSGAGIIIKNVLPFLQSS